MRSWHIGVAFALLILAWCGYWLYASNMVRGAVEGWAAERRAEGDRVEWRSLAVGGFPFRLEVEFTEPAIAVPRLPERPAWRADRLLAIMQPWDFSRVVLQLPRRQDVSFVDDAGRQRDGWATAGEGRASLEFGAGGRVRLASAVASDVTGSLDGSGRTVTVDRLEAHARPSATADGVADVAIAAAGVTLPVAVDAVIGPQVERANADFTVTGPLAPLPIGEAVRHWRDGGGTVEIRQLLAEWDDIRFQAQGTLALDGRNRPIGAMTAELRGHRRLLDRLAAAGRISAGQLGGVRSVLDLLAAAGGGALAVPVRMQDGLLYLADIPLAELRSVLPADAGRNPLPVSPGQLR